MSFKHLALDVVPQADEVGVGSIVLFPQGQYVATAGQNNGGARWHEGTGNRARTSALPPVYTRDKCFAILHMHRFKLHGLLFCVKRVAVYGTNDPKRI